MSSLIHPRQRTLKAEFKRHFELNVIRGSTQIKHDYGSFVWKKLYGRNGTNLPLLFVRLLIIYVYIYRDSMITYAYNFLPCKCVSVQLFAARLETPMVLEDKLGRIEIILRITIV